MSFNKHMEITGVAEIKKRMQKIARQSPKAFSKAIENAALLVQGKAVLKMPIDTGAMADSSRIKKEGNDTLVIVGGKTVRGKDTSKYTIKQHEDLTLNHPEGGEAKFLENAFLEVLPTLEQRIAQEIRKEAL